MNETARRGALCQVSAQATAAAAAIRLAGCCASALLEQARRAGASRWVLCAENDATRGAGAGPRLEADHFGACSTYILGPSIEEIRMKLAAEA